MFFSQEDVPNTLATPDNLSTWGLQVNTKCELEGCNSSCTLGHLLSGCSKSLDSFAYRHYFVLTHLFKTINQHKGESVRLTTGRVGAAICRSQQPPVGPSSHSLSALPTPIQFYLEISIFFLSRVAKINSIPK